MDVITEFSTAGPAGQPAVHAAVRIDRASAVRFLERQSAALQDGLVHAEEPTVVGTVLGTHDACHEEWLALIADAEAACGELAAEALSALYSFQGRVVGSLERGHDALLPGTVTARVRHVLADHLAELTATAVAALDSGTTR